MADTYTADRLQIEIEASSKNAVSSINKLTKSLNSLKTMMSNGFDTHKATQSIQNFADAMSRLRNLDALKDVGDALKGFSSFFRVLDKVEKNGDALDELYYYLAGISQLDFSNLDSFSAAMDSLKRSTDKSSGGTERAARSLKEMTSSPVTRGLKEVSENIRSISGDSKSSTSSLGKLLSSIKRIAFYRVIRTLIKELGEAMKTGFMNFYQWSRMMGKDLAPKMDDLSASALYLKNTLGVGFGNLMAIFAPMFSQLMDRAVDFLNVIHQIVALIQGKDTYIKAVKVEKEFAKATELVDASTGKAADNLKRFLMGIDEINKTGDESIEIGKLFKEEEVENPLKEKFKEFKEWIEGLFGGAGGVSGLKDLVLNISQSIVDAFKNALPKIWDLIKSILSDLLEVAASGRLAETLTHIGNIIKGIIDLAGILAERFRIAWETNDVGKHILENIWDILNIILGGIERAVEITKEWASGLDFYPLLSAFERLTSVLKPFVQLCVDGLLWVYENVLLPVAKWSIEKLFPAMLEVAAAAIEVFTAALEALRPVGEWLWENFLKPLAEWTGERIIQDLTNIKNVLEDFAAFLRGETSFSDFWNNLNFDEKITAISLAVVALEVVIKSAVGMIAKLGAALMTAKGETIFLYVATYLLITAIGQMVSAWDDMTPLQKAIGLLGALTAAALLAAMAMGAFQSATTMGLAALGIGAGILAVVAAVTAAKKTAESQLGSLTSDQKSYASQFKMPNVTGYATGGFPESGDFFLANENGAEYVGSIGGKTAVANNEQIVESVSEGVAYANVGVIGAINQLIAVVQQIDPTVELDGLTLSRGLKKYERQVNREYGAPLAVEVGV